MGFETPANEELRHAIPRLRAVFSQLEDTEVEQWLTIKISFEM